MIDRQRRKYLLGAAALALQVCGGGAAYAAAELLLSDFGGVPGATPGALVDAFEKAFEQLAIAGGGTLVVPPGVYDFGSYGTNERVNYVENLNNVVISAYGATFRLNTTEVTVPTMFYFFNSSNITVTGASFNDTGFDPEVNWRGMYCAKAEADRPCTGFNMVDCMVNGAVGLFQSEQYDQNRFLIRNINLKGTVENAYYGAGLRYAGDNASVDLVCRNVRRGLVAFGLRNASVKLVMEHVSGAPGSNGFVAIVCEGQSQGNVENVVINLNAAGIGTHSGLVHFYHQQSETGGYMRNVDVTVNVSDLRSGDVPTDLFVFDHELPDTVILQMTSREWDQIFLRGSVAAGFGGRIIHKPSISTFPGVIYIHPDLISNADVSMLPASVLVQPV